MAHLAGDRPAAAAEVNGRLARCSGWEARAAALLGVIHLARNDPASAVVAWQHALEHEMSNQDNTLISIVPRKELARALLQVHRPSDARQELKQVLASAPDPEGFWLLSRAFLQEGAMNDAAVAGERASSFRNENPLLPEPSPFIGSKRCAKCHSSIYIRQQGSRHARSFKHVSELSHLVLPPSRFPDPTKPTVTHTLRRVERNGIEQETDVSGQAYRAVIKYAFGSGHQGVTLVGHDDQGRMCELRLSLYSNGKKAHWDVTLGHPADPTDDGVFLGRPLTKDGVRRCFLCHVTDARAVLESSGSVALDRGIGCEKCHGPGGNHVLAVEADFPDLAIADPLMSSGSVIVNLCAQCHSPRGLNVMPADPMSIRFQATTLTWSRCFKQSKDTLHCVTCHDPHSDVETSRTYYDSKCLPCHNSTALTGGSPAPWMQTRSFKPSEAKKCPVNPVDKCTDCHMPIISNVFPHSRFTDHFIRAHRE